MMSKPSTKRVGSGVLAGRIAVLASKAPGVSLKVQKHLLGEFKPAVQKMIEAEIRASLDAQHKGEAKGPEPRLALGDVVVLKGGGPRMTVDDPCSNPGQARCVWFDEKTWHAADFSLGCLFRLS
jgi:uncharacterized protein YodC (DUF2158 family)